MSSSSWRFFACCVMLYSVLALPWAFPYAAYSQEVDPEMEASRDVIEGELRAEMLEQQLHEFLRAGGDRDSDEFQHLSQVLAEARRTSADLRRRLAANNPAETGRRLFGKGRFAGERMQMQAEALQVHIAPLREENERLAMALREAHHELERLRRASMPPLENTETRVFHLRHISGRRIGGTLEELLGPDLIRLSVGPSSHTLVIRAGKEVLSRAESLISEMDQPDVASESENHAMLPRSLMVRIFWLSDGPTHPDAQQAEEFLPGPVINALQRVGIESPFMVLQSNTSIALEEEEEEAGFEVHDLPAIVFHERLLFNAQGEVRAAGGDRIRLRMEAATLRRAGKEHFDESHVSGSVIAPLEHFVVLGTANYASPTPDVPGDGTYDDGAYSSSRFAFVVQTIEAQSFAPEE